MHCTKDPRGRPAKKRERVEVHEDNGSDSESGEEAEDHDLEKDACRLFHRLSIILRMFTNLIVN